MSYSLRILVRKMSCPGSFKISLAAYSNEMAGFFKKSFKKEFAKYYSDFSLLGFSILM